MFEGKGGRVGPDLTGAGASRTVEALIESVPKSQPETGLGMTEPTKEFAQEYETVNRHGCQMEN